MVTMDLQVTCFIAWSFYGSLFHIGSTGRCGRVVCIMCIVYIMV